MFNTMNYYPMFKGCQYKYSKANHKEVMVLNVDINSTEQNKKIGMEICDELDIHFVNPNESYVGNQFGVKAVDEYLTQNNIDSEWIVYFEHDVIPMESDFWDKLDKSLEKIDTDKVSMFSPNSIMDYRVAQKTIGSDNILERRKTKTRTARGNLLTGILENPQYGWYSQLPDEWYEKEHFFVESPYWTCVGFNRKLFREHIEIDSKFLFELWPDDIAHQFLKKGFYNISFTDLMVCHDHYFKKDVKVETINRNQPDSGDYCQEQMRFWGKHGWRWGKRNTNLRKQFRNAVKQYPSGNLQEVLFNMRVSEGPKNYEDLC